MIRRLFAWSFVGLLFVSQIAIAQPEPALDFTGEDTNGFQANLTLGWSFQVNAPVRLTGLGFFDHFETDEDGLSADHLIRVWTDQFDAPALLAQTTISNSSTTMNSAAANGRWLLNEIMPVVLSPGQYVIGADDPACAASCDRFRLVVEEMTIPEITFLEARTASPPGPPMSSQPQLNGGYFGPTMVVQPLLMGDVNHDGAVDLLDVASFVDAIVSGGYIIEADLNFDSIVDLLDVDLFIEILVSS